ncbi:hypothetical protein RRG08_015845 [Elysia crispata]|uniref:Uncharacterized protein n=1 Tax=Elysia crispata TaxID=231223 RepID=A0AAE0Y2P5_9GAST|nr:hypothetical protein RRG08_015845 [Elysia crispata]
MGPVPPAYPWGAFHGSSDPDGIYEGGKPETEVVEVRSFPFVLPETGVSQETPKSINEVTGGKPLPNTSGIRTGLQGSNIKDDKQHPVSHKRRNDIAALNISFLYTVSSDDLFVKTFVVTADWKLFDGLKKLSLKSEELREGGLATGWRFVLLLATEACGGLWHTGYGEVFDSPHSGIIYLLGPGEQSFSEECKSQPIRFMFSLSPYKLLRHSLEKNSSQICQSPRMIRAKSWLQIHQWRPASSLN